ncbi:hypothetical protein B296_00023658 [Ensete ventricosum]|uniref:Uncharacterized protein n=1 Tax=Ensete ventricosum TaxID=4639 RepID=A0A426ZIX5_ENSVE|nr:hypothetical protein B296_00023658 [Ensete ventricosum]
MKALDTLLPDLSPSSSSTALALPCCTTVLPVAAAARPISTSRGSGSWQIHSLFSLSHNNINENDPGVPSPLLADRYDSTPIHRWNCFCPAAQAAVAAAGRESGSLKVPVCFIIFDIGRTGYGSRRLFAPALAIALGFQQTSLSRRSACLHSCSLHRPQLFQVVIY